MSRIQLNTIHMVLDFIFTNEKKNKKKVSEAEKIINFLIADINRRDLVEPTVLLFQKSKELPSEEKDQALIPLYFTLEEFITKNEPLVVVKEYTKENLKAEILKNFSIQHIHQSFRLIFLPEREKWFLFYKNGVDELAHYIEKHLGDHSLRQIVSQLKIEGVENLEMFFYYVQNKDDTQIKIQFSSLYALLYDTIYTIWSKKVADELIEHHYAFISSHYPSEYIVRFLEVVPEQVLKEERLKYLSHSQLEDTVKESTQELEEEKSRLQASLENMPLGVVLSDISQKIISINAKAKALFTLSPEDYRDRTIKDLLGFQPEINTLVLEKMAESVTKGITNELQDIEHGKKIFRLFISPIITRESKSIIGTVLIIQDITEEKLLNRAKDEFFTIASHELRTPLTIVHGYATLLNELLHEKFPDQVLLEMVHNITTSSEGLIRIINDFLDVNRLVQGRVTLRKEMFSMNTLINDTQTSVKVLLEKKNLTFSYENLENKEFMGFADKERTKQALVNLVGNAIKFTTTGGITIHIEEKNDFIYVFVIDTGIGIELKRQNLLFRKFQQAGESLITRDASQGTGLGLYIAKNIMLIMEGDVYLDHSEVGKGSTFVLKVPVAK